MLAWRRIHSRCRGPSPARTDSCCTRLRYRVLADVNLAPTRRWAEPRAETVLRRMIRVCLCAREAYRQLICPEMDVDEGGFALLDASRQRASFDEMHDRRRGLATTTRAKVQTAARLRLLRTDLAREIDDDHLGRPRGEQRCTVPTRLLPCEWPRGGVSP